MYYYENIRSIRDFFKIHVFDGILCRINTYSIKKFRFARCSCKHDSTKDNFNITITFPNTFREEFFPRTCHCPVATPPLKNQLFVPLLFLRYLHFSDESPVIIPLNGSILFTFMSFTSRSRKIHGIRCIVNDRLPRSICHSLGFNCFRRNSNSGDFKMTNFITYFTDLICWLLFTSQPFDITLFNI
jgi:hypothetical protein